MSRTAGPVQLVQLLDSSPPETERTPFVLEDRSWHAGCCQGPPMALHDSITLRIDAPTIAFDRQPTTCFPSHSFAQELFDASTRSTMRPVVAPAASEITSPRRRERRQWLVCVLCFGIGIAAGHIVRERDGYASRAESIAQGLRRSPAVIARAPRQADVQGVRASDVAMVRRKAESSVANAKRRVPSRPNAPSTVPVPSASAAGTSIDGSFVDFELSFRTPE